MQGVALGYGFLNCRDARSKTAVNKINTWIESHTSNNPANIMQAIH